MNQDYDKYEQELILENIHEDVYETEEALDAVQAEQETKTGKELSQLKEMEAYLEYMLEHYEDELEARQRLPIELERYVKLGGLLDAQRDFYEMDPIPFVRKLLTDQCSIVFNDGKSLNFTANMMPGTTWGIEGSTEYAKYLGAPKSRVKLMVIGSNPSFKDYQNNGYNTKYLDEVMKPILTETELQPQDIYYTTAVKMYPPNGEVKQKLVTECKPLLEYEISQIKPDIILALGANVIKALFGNQFTVSKCRANTGLTYNGIPVVTTINPAALEKNPKISLTFEEDLPRIIAFLNGDVKPMAEKNYVYIETVEAMQNAVIDTLLQRSKGNARLAVDCEWGNDEAHEGFKSDKLRYVQWSYKPHQAYVLMLRKCGLVDVFDPIDYNMVVALLEGLLCGKGCEIAGHNFRSDLGHLQEIGIDCINNLTFDTMTAFHFLYPQADGMGLEHLSHKYSDCGRYDVEIEDWIKENKMGGDVKLYGYANIPDEILAPYSAYDTDVVIQAWPQIETELREKELSDKYKGYEVNGVPMMNQLDVYNHVVRQAEVPTNEVERTGLPMDLARMKTMQKLFQDKKEQLTKEIREWVEWPELSLESDDDFKELLFGRQYGKEFKDKETGGKVRGKSPQTARLLNLEPVKTTEKYARPWEELSEDDKTKVNPSTNTDSMQTLKERYPAYEDILQLLVDYKTLGQVTKNFLRPPDEYDELGEPVYRTGLIGRTDKDGFLRGSFSQLTETGRFRSYNPNLNNLSANADLPCTWAFCKDREEMGKINWKAAGLPALKEKGWVPEELYKLRSIVKAPPGYLIVGADYSQAELFTLARICGDENMISVMEDPLRDLHSETAASAFNLEIPDDTGDLSRADYIKKYYDNERFLAKTINFGIVYQRGAGALARQVDCSFDEAQSMIDAVYDSYPRMRDYVVNQKAQVDSPGYAENPYGRRRYFFQTDNKTVMAAQKRESVNFPIQSCVADTLPIAMNNLIKYREANPKHQYKVILPFHDAIYLLVPCHEVYEVVNKVVPLCMTEQAEVPNIGLKLQTDADVYYHWEEKTGSIENAIAMSLGDL